MGKSYTVRAAHCDHRASDEEVYQALRRVTDPLTRSWSKIEKAKKVVIKFNMMIPPHRVIMFKGRRRELVDDAVCRATLRLLKEHTTAELVATDTDVYSKEKLMGTDFNYAHHLKAFGVKFVDSNAPPFETFRVPGGGSIFDQYNLNACFAEADAVVSVVKMKSHGFMGLTLCMKNLFGLTPISPPAGRVRKYFHHIIRLPYVLPDLGLITQPCLNIIDALTGQTHREWDGRGRICDALIAGDQVTATDACGAHLMGHDPTTDWPTPPFRRDRNHLLIAARRGFGTVDLEEIDFESEVKAPLAAFDSAETDTPETVLSWRKTTCEQALFYLDQKKDIVDRFRGEFVFLQDGKVVWSGDNPYRLPSRRQLCGDHKEKALWLKLVDPDEVEGEQYQVYDQCLGGMAA